MSLMLKRRTEKSSLHCMCRVPRKYSRRSLTWPRFTSQLVGVVLEDFAGRDLLGISSHVPARFRPSARQLWNNEVALLPHNQPRRHHHSTAHSSKEQERCQSHQSRLKTGLLCVRLLQ